MITVTKVTKQIKQKTGGQTKTMGKSAFALNIATNAALRVRQELKVK